jgi:hypothetical protein
MRHRLAVVVAAVLVLSGCAQGEPVADHTFTFSIPKTPTNPTSPTASFEWNRVAVSAGCAAAFKAAEEEMVATEGGVDTALIQTGTDCPSVDEWLSALQDRPGAFGMTANASIDPQIELSALCWPARDIPVCHDADSRGLRVYEK